MIRKDIPGCDKICAERREHFLYRVHRIPLPMPRSNTNPNVFTSLLNVPQFPFADELVAELKGLFDFSVPDGYEDETGFHFVNARNTAPVSAQTEPEWLGEYI